MFQKIIVASKNPVKIQAAELGFQRLFPDTTFTCEGISVPSGVPDQPMGDAETLQGAMNRASNAQQTVPDADFWVGIEGGIEKKGDEMEAFAWIVVKSRDQLGKARTGTFFLPKRVVALINEGMELGDADDIVFGGNNSKQKNGAVGILTGDVIVRSTYYAEAVVLALIPFHRPELY